MKRWQDCEPFVTWLEGMEYAGNVSDGLILYMWEAWQAGQEALRPTSLSDGAEG